MAEKLETIITRATTNTRMRDFYDIYILEQLYGKTLNPDVFQAALQATAQKRETERYLTEAEETIHEVENSDTMQALWAAYQEKFSYAAELKWDMVIGAVYRVYALAGSNEVKKRGHYCKVCEEYKSKESSYDRLLQGV